MQLIKLVYQMPHGGRLNISNFAIEKLQQWRQVKSSATEAGGFLLGRHLIDSLNIIIDDITTPLKCDNRSRCVFFRSFSHNQVARAKWVESKRTCSTLGTWHSHPETYPKPSLLDFRDWESTLKKGRYPGNYFFFLILGIDNLRLWLGYNTDKIIELHTI